jgi:hypothetical protein
MKGAFVMRKIYPVFLMVSVLLSLGWTSAFSTTHQDCCHPSVARSAAPATTPTTPMSSLNTDDVRREFNVSSDKVRIVALLSPTCPGCRSGHTVVGQVLKKFSSPKLQAILVWEPMREGDSPTTATQQAAAVQDMRIKQGWNEDKNVGKLFGETLDMHDIAWDVYLVYKPGIKWEAQQPPHPTFWMHQLEGADPKLLLCENPTRLNVEVGKLLGQTD